MFGATAGAKPAPAHCYPRLCSGADAHLNGIGLQTQPMYAGFTYDVRVSGQNIGNVASRINTGLRTNDGSISPGNQTVFARPNQSYAEFYRYKPTFAEVATLSACTNAVPRDSNHGNNCGHISTRIKNVPRF